MFSRRDPNGIGLANELTANENGRGIARACEPWSELAGKWLNRETPMAERGKDRKIIRDCCVG